ncbi:hypothetical protein [Pararhodobacter zhoushanensis]|uniref:Uncharacterized protein n=1 Tax=Pararhodobacter zhoushanensis TaxID=2479545 RepID=A0ABT3H4M5_9RHOB|nr:hypothetical protein [Pararhodobacter zhoushanensis]MCW1934635.1 hypothetical protein [Pararhodobacter zhoushanensis]
MAEELLRDAYLFARAPEAVDAPPLLAGGVGVILQSRVLVGLGFLILFGAASCMILLEFAAPIRPGKRDTA